MTVGLFIVLSRSRFVWVQGNGREGFWLLKLLVSSAGFGVGVEDGLSVALEDEDSVEEKHTMGKFYFKKISLGTCPHIREEVATLELLEEYGNIINNFPAGF